MKYYVVYEMLNGFQQEIEENYDSPPPIIKKREFDHLPSHHFSYLYQGSIPGYVHIRESTFFLTAKLYAMGKQILYYKERR